MSDVEEPKEDNKASQTDVSVHEQECPEEKVTKNQDFPGITINFYSATATQKSDKPVQTEPSNTELVPKLSKKSNLKTKKPGNLTSESREIRSFEYSSASYKKFPVVSHETRQSKLMNTRKFAENKPTGRTATDLERKKLEAELKATEEIAKIQQTVIEKRLALELASLQNGSDPHQKTISPQTSIPHADMRILEDIARKQTLIDQNLKQELDSKDWNAKPIRPPPPSAPPRPPPPSRAPASDVGKMYSLKTDSSLLTQTSSEISSLRQLIEKKINLDKRLTRKVEPKPSPPPTMSQEVHFTKKNKSPAYPSPVQPSCSPQEKNRYKARTLWKTAMKKIKKKVKPGAKAP